ncbi:MAG: DUF4403 family protein [Proteobacteria bacterium]|nr:DUF4403 family protein [Pseudomonadota bacterium]
MLAGIGGFALLVPFFLVLWLLPDSSASKRPALAEVPPLKPIARSSVIIAPTTIPIAAIRQAIEPAAPRNLVGRREGNGRDIPIVGEVGWTIDRSPFTVSGRPEGLAIATVLNGTFRATGKLGEQLGGAVGGALGDVLGNVVGGNFGRQVQQFAGKTLDQKAELRGNVLVTARPTILPSWRFAPNLSGQVTVAELALPIAPGIRINVSNEIRPLLERTMRDQLAVLETRVRNDPVIEQTARREWTKICRSIAVGGGAGLPSLWLEIRPTRIFAAQPRVDQAAVHLVMGVDAQTRVLPAQTKPDCPFPARLDIVPEPDKGRVSVGVPIDLPFSEVNKLLEPQLKGRKFPEDSGGAVEVTVRGATLAASGDRLLISLAVTANEKKSWFGLGAQAQVHVWGRPILDAAAQTLRFTDIALDVESRAAFGLLGAAARIVAPQLQAAIAQRAVIDLKPFAADAKKRVDAALAEFRKQTEGVRINATIEAVRLVGIDFDAKTLRVIAEADGVVDVAVTSLALP